MIKAVLNTIRSGWIVDAELRSELLAIVSQIVRANRVLAAVAIDDVIVGETDLKIIEPAQALLQAGNALVKEAMVWEEMDEKAARFTNAIRKYQHAWQVALK